MKVILDFEFEGEVSEEAIVENIANHLMHDIGSAGIVGDDDDGYTKAFTVESENLSLNVDMLKHKITTI
jgi:hypothetical protein